MTVPDASRTTRIDDVGNGAAHRFRYSLRRHLPALVLLLFLTLLAYQRLALQDRILLDYDAYTYFYPNESYSAAALRAGALPLWNPYLFTGVPFLANPQTGVFYPANLLFLLCSVPRAFAYSIVLHVYLAAVFAYAFAAVGLRLRPAAALVVAIVFAFSGFIGALAGHINQLQASTWLPLILLFAALVYRRVSTRMALCGSLAIAVQFLAGHMQEFYLSMVGSLLFVAWLFVRREGGFGRSVTLRRLALFALMAVLAVALTAIQLLPTYELTRESIRAGGLTYQDATSFSLPPWLLLRGLLPAYGDPQPYSEWIGYVGVVSLVLAAFAIVRPARHRHTPFFAAVALLALLLALGQFNPLSPALYHYLPGLNLFRVPARWLLLYSFSMAALAGIGVQSALANRPVGWHQAWHALVTPACIVLVIGGLLLVAAMAMNPKGGPELPSLRTAALWLAPYALMLTALAAHTRLSPRLTATVVLTLLAGELLLAGLGMPANRVNLPEAYSALRPAVAHLLGNGGLYRVLPFSEAAFDPGDLPQIKEMLGPVLPPDAVYDYVVAVKHKETLTPNLPLRFRIPSIDGYDGGVLPLRRYVELKSILPLSTPNTPDGRLREQLASIPDPKLLGWLNVRHVLMDRLRDVWVDGYYYDLALSRRLGAKASVSLSNVPALEATTIGVISHLEGAQSLGAGAPIAELAVTLASGAVYTTTMRAGDDSAEGRYGASATPPAHPEAKRAKSWRGEPNAWDYTTTITLPTPSTVRQIRFVREGDVGDFVLRGVTLIDKRRQMSDPVVIDDDLHLTYLGDVKIYENQRVLERAFLVPTALAVRDDQEALAAMGRPDFDATREAVVTGDQLALAGGSISGDGSSFDGQASILDYQPEHIRVATSSATAALLVLTDSDYPGWRASVDGKPASLFRADHVFRAVGVPAGTHEVAFDYQPDSLRYGAAISGVALLAVIAGLCAGSLRRSSTPE